MDENNKNKDNQRKLFNVVKLAQAEKYAPEETAAMISQRLPDIKITPDMVKSMYSIPTPKQQALQEDPYAEIVLGGAGNVATRLPGKALAKIGSAVGKSIAKRAGLGLTSDSGLEAAASAIPKEAIPTFLRNLGLNRMPVGKNAEDLLANVAGKYAGKAKSAVDDGGAGALWANLGI